MLQIQHADFPIPATRAVSLKYAKNIRKIAPDRIDIEKQEFHATQQEMVDFLSLSYLRLCPSRDKRIHLTLKA
jgi:hypothetical protein